MSLPTVFETCAPREDVLRGAIAEADFAADLAKVIRGIASDDYQKPDRFFSNTYPTQGLKNLLRNVLARLTGDPGAAAAIFRLDTSYGGGKTHGAPDQIMITETELLPLMTDLESFRVERTISTSDTDKSREAIC